MEGVLVTVSNEKQGEDEETRAMAQRQAAELGALHGEIKRVLEAWDWFQENLVQTDAGVVFDEDVELVEAKVQELEWRLNKLRREYEEQQAAMAEREGSG